jgi:hypothetical protein
MRYRQFKMKIKEREESILETKTNFHYTNNEKSVLSKINPKLIEAYLAREIAKAATEDCKLPVHQITIFADRGVASNFQSLTIPLVGDEVTIHGTNGKEQIYKVVKIRHSAYLSATELQSSSNSSAIIWCELIHNPTKIGAIF